MTRILAVVAVNALLVGCSLSEERYQERAPDAACAYFDTCDPPFYDDLAECRAEQATDLAAPEGCTYDPDAARSCVDALESTSCEGSASNYPSVCSDVYDCG